MNVFTLRGVVVALLLAALALLPVYASAAGNPFALVLGTRIIILAIAAASLNLIMGYGGMVSFGHAVYLGIGGYAVGILAQEGVASGALQWPVALLASALFALITGALSLRTRGVYFIMITLAFSQMLYYVVVSISRYGGDDGLTIYQRSTFAGYDLSDRTVFYYLCLALLLGTLALICALARSRFGRVIRGAKANETRMLSLGYPVYRYRLVCFVIAGVICGLAGALLANHTEFISPATMHWTRSGDLIVMVVLGGMGSVFGPLFGAIALLALEETLSRITTYWPILLGPLLLAVVLYGRGGLDALLSISRAKTPTTRMRK